MGSEKRRSLGRPELEGNACRIRVVPGRAVHGVQHCRRHDLENPALEMGVSGKLAGQRGGFLGLEINQHSLA
jgi:hypothetical protein